MSKRLSEQGFINLHRKPIFRILCIGLVAYLFYVPDLWELPGTGVICAQVAGTQLIVAGILGRILATISIGGLKDRTVVKSELYSVCRNPLYFSSFVMALGTGMLSGRADFTLLISVSYIAIFWPMMVNEADYLRKRFTDFAEYEKRVPLFIPNFTLWEQRASFVVDFKRVRQTLLDASLGLLAIPVMILVRALL